MKILFTGASSFSGMWFVKELAKAGHTVIATFRNPIEFYQNLRKERIGQILDLCRPVFNAPFGGESFFKVVSEEKNWDLFCHHAADVTNYKSNEFDAVAALANNTKNLKQLIQLLVERNCQRLLLTGSVFEQHEGAGSDHLRAVSPYGLSKGLTSEFFNYYTSLYQIKLAKFVIPNPFGPYEEARFTTYLIQNWIKKDVAPISSPLYVRDNVPISLLAKAYASFASTPIEKFVKLNPSFYVESQGTFTQRFATEMRKRMRLPCEFELNEQKEFSEPRIRINTDPLTPEHYDWNETQAWDELALFYKNTYQKK